MESKLDGALEEGPSIISRMKGYLEIRNSSDNKENTSETLEENSGKLRKLYGTLEQLVKVQILACRR